MRPARGFTLIELMASLAILSIAIATTTLLVVEGVRWVRASDQTAQGQDASRMALELIARDALQAGAGASQGIWVNRGSVAGKINPVFGGDVPPNTGNLVNGTDELWLVVPHPQALQESCLAPGGAATIAARGFGAIAVTCTRSLFPNGGNLLLATNWRTGALLTGASVTSVGGLPGLDYNESGLAGFADDEKKGYQVGDVVFPVTAIHYSVQLDPVTRRPALFRAVGTLPNPGPPQGQPPFVETGTPTLVARFIEDFQVVFGVDPAQTGDPRSIRDLNVLGPDYDVPANTHGLRTLRLSVVSLSQQKLIDANHQPGQAYAPRAVENHLPAPIPDGYKRNLYTRRVELLNQAPGDL